MGRITVPYQIYIYTPSTADLNFWPLKFKPVSQSLVLNRRHGLTFLPSPNVSEVWPPYGHHKATIMTRTPRTLRVTKGELKPASNNQSCGFGGLFHNILPGISRQVPDTTQAGPRPFQQPHEGVVSASCIT